MPAEFKPNEDGEVEVHPVTGWKIKSAFDIAVALLVQYQKTSSESGNREDSIALLLTPQQSLELSEALKRRADSILAGDPGEKPN